MESKETAGVVVGLPKLSASTKEEDTRAKVKQALEDNGCVVDEERDWTNPPDATIVVFRIEPSVHEVCRLAGYRQRPLLIIDATERSNQIGELVADERHVTYRSCRPIEIRHETERFLRKIGIPLRPTHQLQYSST